MHLFLHRPHCALSWTHPRQPPDSFHQAGAAHVQTMFFQRLQQLFRGDRASARRSLAAGPLASSSPRDLTDADRIDLQRAIIEHLEWCVLLNICLGRDGVAQVAELPDAPTSGLGRWLASARTGALGTHPLFAELASEQQRFHQLANQALAFAEQDQMHLASTLLNTDFERSRARILDILRTMQRD
jgi:hypothetical protein